MSNRYQENDLRINKKRVLFILWVLLVCFLFPACEKKTEKAPPPPKNISPVYNSEKFNAASAFSWLEKTVKMGNRYYGAPERKQAIQHLKGSLSKYSDKVETEVFFAVEKKTKITYELENIVGRTDTERTYRILIGSHWDTRLWAEEDPDPAMRNKPIEGANDGSSGLAVIVELLRLFREKPLENIGIDAVFFDGEEFGRPGNKDYCKGSIHYAASPLLKTEGINPRYVIVLDMIADKDLNIHPERNSMLHAPNLMNLIWDAAKNRKTDAFKVGIKYTITDDHSAFNRIGIPSVLLIDFDYPYWHTQKDIMDKVDAKSLGLVGNVVLDVIRKIDRYHGLEK